MSRNLLTIILLSITLSTRAATLPLYEFKTAVLSETPQVDAVAVVNYANLVLGGLLPYETQNTLFWTNKNSLASGPGFLFDYLHPVNGNLINSPLNTFVNKGVVDGIQRVLVRATNITSQGLMLSGANGIVDLRGQELQLQGGGFEASGIFADLTSLDITNGVLVLPNSTGQIFQAPFVPTPGPTYYPLSAAIGINEFIPSRFPGGLQLSTFGPGTFVGGITFDQINYSYSRGNWFADERQARSGSAGGSGAYAAFAFTNANFTQVVFVRTNQLAGVQFGVEFFDTGGPQVAGVTFQSTQFDNVSLQTVTENIIIQDDLATRTNYVYYAGQMGLRVPTNYLVGVNVGFFGRVAPLGTSASANAPYSRNLLNGPQYLGRNVTNNYASYSFKTDPLKLPQGIVSPYLAPAPTDPFGDPTASTNLPGRIEISGGNVNLAKSRLKAGTSIDIKATNLINGVLPTLDAPFINLDLISTASSVTVSNWYPQTVERFGGTIKAFSSTWTNDYATTTNVLVTTITNIDLADTNSLLATLPPSEFITNNFLGFGVQFTNFFSTNSFLTNIAGANLFVTNLTVTNLVTTNAVITNTTFFHILIVDPAFINNLQVRVDNFVLRAADIHIGDTLFANENVKFTTPNLTIDPASSITTPVNLSVTNFIGLMNFTNNGLLSSGGFIRLGSDRVTPLVNLVNNGTISGDSVEIGALIISNNFSIQASGFLKLQGPEVDVGGDVFAGVASFVYADKLKLMSGGLLESGGDLYLQVTNVLDDSSGGQLLASTALTIPFRPAQGDLLNSVVTLSPGSFKEFVLTWPGEDRGPSASGFVNNLAIGELQVDATALLSSARISGAAPGSAIYVKTLSLFGNAADVGNGLIIDDNITLYVDNVTANGAAVSVSDLTTLTGGRIVQASAPPAPALNGNNFPTSLNGSSVALKVKYSPTPTPTALLSWNSIANTTNFVEFKNVSSNAQWTGMTNIFSGVATNLTYSDKIGTNTSRFYRVRSSPKVP
ncbi:MAG: hypothetical protein JWN25_3317 [Verrucomicrobiales bacterium]|nr:hypothetical protein [Verrucomicrobiales bacterium]